MGRASPCRPDREGEHPHAARMEAIVWRISRMQRRSQRSDYFSLLRSPYDWKGDLETDDEGAGQIMYAMLERYVRKFMTDLPLRMMMMIWQLFWLHSVRESETGFVGSNVGFTISTVPLVKRIWFLKQLMTGTPLRHSNILDVGWEYKQLDFFW